jgi:hypothetical protein
MKKLLALSMLILLALVFYAGAAEKAPPSETLKSAPCASCHDRSKDLLGKDHPEAQISDMAACLSCHKPNLAGKAEPNPFSAKLHKSHLNEPTFLECTVCHTWSPEEALGLPGQEISFGKASEQDMAFTKKIFTSWATSSYLDGLHARKDLTCSSCHGKGLAERGDLVENERCLTCHGPFEKLVQRSAPKDFPDRNPHFSHLGEIDCTVCHMGHSASSVYCLGCHPRWTMKIPGGE